MLRHLELFENTNILKSLFFFFVSVFFLFRTQSFCFIDWNNTKTHFISRLVTLACTHYFHVRFAPRSFKIFFSQHCTPSHSLSTYSVSPLVRVCVCVYEYVRVCVSVPAIVTHAVLFPWRLFPSRKIIQQKVLFIVRAFFLSFIQIDNRLSFPLPQHAPTSIICVESYARGDVL